MTHDDASEEAPAKPASDEPSAPARDDVSDGSTVRSPEDAELNDDD